MSKMDQQQIKVQAPARLHMGFMDMHGGLGRSYGSLGLCLEGLSTSIVVRDSGDLLVVGPSAYRAEKYAKQILRHYNFADGAEITIKSAIPEHMGLGSGTQMSLAIGVAISQAKGSKINIADIALSLGRGVRSGIGIGAFKYGGFLVDGGCGENTHVPPVISRMNFPEAWRILLVLDYSKQGVHASEEVNAFQSLSKMQDVTVNHLCRIVVMQILPALAEQNCQTFGEGITEIQNCVGDHFYHVQGGRYASNSVASILEWAKQQSGATGVGQSSWGPTGFVIFPNETQAYQVMKKAREIFSDSDQIKFLLTRARNQMAEAYLEQSQLSNRLNIQNL